MTPEQRAMYLPRALVGFETVKMFEALLSNRNAANATGLRPDLQGALGATPLRPTGGCPFEPIALADITDEGFARADAACAHLYCGGQLDVRLCIRTLVGCFWLLLVAVAVQLLCVPLRPAVAALLSSACRPGRCFGRAQSSST
jgi:hypothetical protein